MRHIIFSVFFLTLFILQGNAQNTSTAHPKNIILLIGDGMGTAQIYSGLIANKGHLNIERCKYIGFHKNQTAKEFVTDSGAGATAFAIGKKSYNGAVGVDATKVAYPSILEIANKNNLSTGLVTACNITDATPAAFIAHQPSRGMEDEIAADFLKTNFTLLIGGGKDNFNKRKDHRNLLDSLRAKNYQVVDSMANIVNIKSGKLAGFIAAQDPPKVSEGRGGQLQQSAQTAINILNQNKKGFFLMLEGSQIDWGGHENDAQYVINEMVDFDKAIGAVLDFAEKDGNTLVIITADHETGGMAITNGDMQAGTVEAKFITKGHTGVMIPVFAYGPGAEAFSGIYQNTDIFTKMLEAYQFNK